MESQLPAGGERWLDVDGLACRRRLLLFDVVAFGFGGLGGCLYLR